jgi:ATP-dependent Lon protease
MNYKNPFFQYMLPDVSNDEAVEIVPLLSEDDVNELANSADFPELLPILPVRNIVLFPGVVIPITVGRKKSIKLVKKAYKGDRIIGVMAQQRETLEDPGTEDLYKTGTVAQILKMLVMPDGNTTIIVQGRARFQLEKVASEEPFMTAKVKVLPESFPAKNKKEAKAMMSSLKESALKILRLNPEIPQEAQIALDNIESISFLTHFLCSNINAELPDKQKLLETDEGMMRATLLLEYMSRDIQLLELKHEIQNKVHSDLDQQQRDYFLRQQMKVLQDELGYESGVVEIEELRAKATKKKWPQAVAQHFEKELGKMMRANPASPEYPIALNYIELLLELPWQDFTKDDLQLKHAQAVLDEDHHGLEKVKERILEYLAVLKLKNNLRSPILCLYGPPGVGKTSLGRSIAKALGRKYVRMSLGGLHDEAEIRGHRKTYIGAMPGKVIQNIKKAGSSNPVFILDEIDKLSSDFRGDPSSALLEVLDPEQNSSFVDNYLEVEYDLSQVMFIATANSLDTIQPALRDRMEIIEISGYTTEEKLEIAKKHLVQKQRKEHGLQAKQLKIEDAALRKIIEDYTRESGVRQLERQIGSLVRKIAKAVAMEESYPKTIKAKDIPALLGAERFEKEVYEQEAAAGVVTGLAWTAVGGEILFIEAILSRGRGKLTLSGQLGDVMKESATTALSYLKAQAESLHIDHRVFEHFDLHVHVPAGAVPKDGPSAGITIFTALASIFTQRKVKERIAMTGEITLRGRVLPVGGIKEKLLAAKRAGVEEVILSIKNKRDIEEIPAHYLQGLRIHYVQHAEEVLALALSQEKVARPVDLSIPKNKKAEA